MGRGRLGEDLALLGLLEAPGVLERERRRVGEPREEPELRLREHPLRPRRERQDAEHLAARDERHGDDGRVPLDDGPRVQPGWQAEAPVVRDVARRDRPTVPDRERRHARPGGDGAPLPLVAVRLAGRRHADEVARGRLELEEAGAVASEVVEHGRDNPLARLGEIARADQLMADAGQRARGLLRLLPLGDVAHDHEQLRIRAAPRRERPESCLVALGAQGELGRHRGRGVEGLAERR